jgi:hypothetical protein
MPANRGHRAEPGSTLDPGDSGATCCNSDTLAGRRRVARGRGPGYDWLGEEAP